MAGIDRRSVMLAGGRYAMVDDGKEFHLVPWKPVIEQRLGKQIAAVVLGGSVSYRHPAAGAWLRSAAIKSTKERMRFDI